MATDESARHRLYEQARTSWGDDAASTLMTALPRDPDRFATKDDLAVLEAKLRGELRSEISGLRVEMTDKMSTLLRSLQLTIAASNATLVGLVFAAIRLG